MINSLNSEKTKKVYKYFLHLVTIYAMVKYLPHNNDALIISLLSASLFALLDLHQPTLRFEKE